MSGYLRKRISENKIFCRTRFPKRFFVINFRFGTISIYQCENDFLKKPTENVKVIYFRDVKQISTFDECADNLCEKASKNFQYPFIVDTTQRRFELHASSVQERNMWITGFTYILVSTTEVQSIMTQQAKE